MRLLYVVGLVISLTLLVCSALSMADATPDGENRDASSPVPSEPQAATKATRAKGAAITTAVPFAPPRTSPYRLLGILDPDRDRMVAFALKVPSDWRAQQEFYRKWEGAVGSPQISPKDNQFAGILNYLSSGRLYPVCFGNAVTKATVATPFSVGGLPIQG